ncbi:MAG: hypothetical protein IJK86_05035 [Lachnospiraceae bacterium]|nr:hypothetical protein [Lachnospiraceae bacterium]
MKKNPMEVLPTEELEDALEQTRPGGLGTYFRENEEALLTGEKPFADYMRRLMKEKGLLQQEVFLAADIPETYGYRLISQERHTRQRDVILRLCFGARFTLKETQRALRLAGQEELYARIKRDAALILALNEGMKVDQVNELLVSYGFEPLKKSGKND